MQLFDALHQCHSSSAKLPIDQLTSVIDTIRHDAIIGDSQPNARQLRSQIFRVTDNIGIPLLYLSLMNTITWQGSTAKLIQVTESLLDINVPYDIPYAAVPSIYHAIVRASSANIAFLQLIIPCLELYIYP
jgi:hypothetical protein